MTRRSDWSGFTLVEVLVLAAVVGIIVAVLLPRLVLPPPRAPRMKCVSNLKNIGLSFQIFAKDNGDRFPVEVLMTNGTPREKIDVLRVYLMLSNELSTAKILYCPSDQKRREAESFGKIGLKNISYFASLSAGNDTPQAFLAGDRNLERNGVVAGTGLLALTETDVLSWSKEIHGGEGNIAMGDGSVQQFSSMQLKQGLLDQREIATNYLAMP